MCWLNTDIKHVCELAILGLNDYLPWKSAKFCFQHQLDFNYLEARHLWEDAQVSKDGIHIAGMHYKALIVEVDVPAQAKAVLEEFERAGRVIIWRENNNELELVSAIERLVSNDVKISPENENVRVRHVIKNGFHCYLIFNEGEDDITVHVHFGVEDKRYLMDVKSEKIELIDKETALYLPAHKIEVILVSDSFI